MLQLFLPHFHAFLTSLLDYCLIMSSKEHQRFVIPINPEDINPCFQRVLERILKQPAFSCLPRDDGNFRYFIALFCSFYYLFLRVRKRIYVLYLSGNFSREGAKARRGVSDSCFY